MDTSQTVASLAVQIVSDASWSRTQPGRHLLEPHAQTLALIKECFADRDRYRDCALPLLERCAEFAQCLPATQSEHFATEGGLLHFALRTAHRALVSTEAVILGDSQGRLELGIEEIWQYAVFASATCHALRTTFNRCELVSTTGQSFRAGAGESSPHAWALSADQAGRFRFRWRDAPVDSPAAWWLDALVPQAGQQWFEDVRDRRLRAYMEQAIEGQENEDNLIYALIRAVSVRLIHHNLGITYERQAFRPTFSQPETSPDLYAASVSPADSPVSADLQLGTAPQEMATAWRLLRPVMVNVMGELIRTKAWTINQRKSRLWHAQDGLYLIWPTAGKEMCSLLMLRNDPSLPRSVPALLECLRQCELIQDRSPSSSTWHIRLPTTQAVYESLRLTNVDDMLSFAAGDPDPLALNLACESANSPASTSLLEDEAPDGVTA